MSLDSRTYFREDIIDIGCGDEHVVAVADGGRVFAWGNGANGRLGTGNTSFAPVAVQAGFD